MALSAHNQQGPPELLNRQLCCLQGAGHWQRLWPHHLRRSLSGTSIPFALRAWPLLGIAPVCIVNRCFCLLWCDDPACHA